ncbi:MAG: hypothetical protein HKO53_19280 [Gemmatimonadetes bacterium]|nr:hypothetical protein [Gemmatimonadota bacterium]
MAAFPVASPAPWLPTMLGLGLGLLGYFPERLDEVQRFSDIGRSGQHLCIAYHGDWGFEYCRAPGESGGPGWISPHLACLAGDQRRPTWLDAWIEQDLDGALRPFVVSPYLPDRDWLKENIEDCNWLDIQIKTVGGEVPGTGQLDPDHPYWGAYRFGYEYSLPALLPAPEQEIVVDRAAFAATIERIETSPTWEPLSAAGWTWGQIAMTCQVLLFESTPVQGTGIDHLLALALWAHAVWETTHAYGPWLVAATGLPPRIPRQDPRLISVRDQLRGVYPRDASVATRNQSWGSVKSRFPGSGG